MPAPSAAASIHPRAYLPNGRKKNTAAPHSARHGGAGGKTHRKVMKRLMVRIKDWEALSPANRVGRRRPGAMQP